MNGWRRTKCIVSLALMAWLALALLVPAAGYVGWWLFFDPSGQTGGVPRTVRQVGSGACLVFVLARM